MGGCGSSCKTYSCRTRRLPLVPSVLSLSVSPQKKSSLVFTRPRDRVSVQTFCAIGPVYFSVPICLAYSFSGSVLAGTVPRPTWSSTGPRWLQGPHRGPLWRKHASEQGKWLLLYKRESLFVKLGLYYLRLGVDQALFKLTSQIPKPSLGPSPDQSIF